MKLSIKEAYEVMFLFLEEYYQRTDLDDIGSLLGDLQLLKDNKPADPAAWEDWMECVKEIKSKRD